MHGSFRVGTNESRPMDLVSAGMGEAVLGYGDGIEVVNKVQDGGVYAELKEGIGVAKGIRDVQPKNGTLEPSPMKCQGGKMDSDSLHKGAAVESGSTIYTHFVSNARPTHLANGKAGREGVVWNGSAEGGKLEEKAEEGAVKCNGDKGGGSMVNGVSHAANSGCPDNLVEMVIQCLDEKVDRETLTTEALELLRLVPEGYIPLPHQVGGHRHVDGKLGFLRKIGEDDVLYKPVQPGVRGSVEVQFYEGLFGSTGLPLEVINLRELVPNYYGRETIRDRAGQLHEFLKLEDITHRFKHPCIMDVKVGRRVWDDFAEKDKIDRERKKYPAQETLGYRIIGMRVYQPSTSEYIYYDKWYGRSIREDTALLAVRNFFVCGEVNRVDVIPSILQKLEEFLQWFRLQTSLRLFATSLLIVYEGSPNSESLLLPPVDIRLVDFAHTYEAVAEAAETDGNTLYGLENFAQCLSILKNQI